MVNFAITDDSEKKPQRRNRSRRRRFRGQAEDRQPGNWSGLADSLRSSMKKMSCVCILIIVYLCLHLCIYIENLHCIVQLIRLLFLKCILPSYCRYFSNLFDWSNVSKCFTWKYCWEDHYYFVHLADSWDEACHPRGCVVNCVIEVDWQKLGSFCMVPAYYILLYQHLIFVGFVIPSVEAKKQKL